MEDNQLVRIFVRMTPRQRQIVHLVSQGLTNAQIGQRLFIASGVVAAHLTNIYAELNAHDIDENPHRYTVIRLFIGFLTRHPDLDPFSSDKAS